MLGLHKTTGRITTKLGIGKCWGSENKTLHFSVDPGIVFHFLLYCEVCRFFHIFIDYSENNRWILMKKVQGLEIYECALFGADPNKNLDLVNLTVVSYGDSVHFNNSATEYNFEVPVYI